MHPKVPDGTGEGDDLDQSPGPVRDGHLWVSADQGTGREREKEGEKERKGTVKSLD